MLTSEEYDEIISQVDDPNIKEKDFAEMLKCLTDLYHNSVDPEEAIPDVLFDELVNIYEKRYNKKWKMIGVQVRKERGKVQLDYYLGSMDKITLGDDNPEKAIKRWLATYKGPFVIEEKLDGVSALLIYYPNGDRKMFTRGNGVKGQDITHLIKYLNVPELNLDKKMAVRGELIISKKKFKPFFSRQKPLPPGKFSNPRNMVSGQVNRKEGTIEKSLMKEIDFVVFEILEPRTMTFGEQITNLKKLGFTIPIYINKKKISVPILTEILKDFRDKSKYEMDGVVIYDNSRNYTRNLKDNPKYAFAFKALTKTAEVIVDKVVWSLSKHGLLKPVVKLKFPVYLENAEITNVTAHNAKRVVDDGLGPGAKILITRSGYVIPKILKSIKKVKPQMPDQDYEWNKNHVDLIHIGKDKSKMDIKQLEYFFKTLEIADTSSKTLEKLYKKGYNNLFKLVNATVDDFSELEGFQERKSQKLYDNLHNAIKNVELSRLMTASSVFGQGLGKRKLILIVKKYPNIMNNKWEKEEFVEKILEIKGFAKKTAEQFVEKFNDFKKFLKDNPDITYKLDKKKKEKKKEGTLTDQIIVVTGRSNLNKIPEFDGGDLESAVIEQGGEINTSGIKNETTMLVATEERISKGSGKLKNAEKKGITIMNLDDFIKKYLK